MKTILEMAIEAGFLEHEGTLYTNHKFGDCFGELERFAEIVRADEREKYKWDIHSCGPTCKRYACVATREAVAAEREACARIAEEPNATTYECTVAIGGAEQTFTQRMPKDAHEIAKQIRARGNA